MSAKTSLRPTYSPEKGLLPVVGTGGALEKTPLLFFLCVPVPICFTLVLFGQQNVIFFSICC